jgi:hypothetical protein
MSAGLINDVGHAVQNRRMHSTGRLGVVSRYFTDKRNKYEEGKSYYEVVISRIFRIRERETTIQNEIKAGCVHFVSVAFLLAVNPVLLADAGYNKETVAAATGISTGVACILSGIVCNLPFGNQEEIVNFTIFKFFFFEQQSLPQQLQQLFISRFFSLITTCQYPVEILPYLSLVLF